MIEWQQRDQHTSSELNKGNFGKNDVECNEVRLQHATTLGLDSVHYEQKKYSPDMAKIWSKKAKRSWNTLD